MWFKVDDGWARHKKVRKAGSEGRALWITAGTMCAGSNTGGLVEESEVEVYGFYASLENPWVGAGALVESGLWHDAKTIRKCPKCKEAVAALPTKKLREGDYYFHDWLDYQFTKDEATIPDALRKRQRNRALNRDRKLVALILDRDGTLCRYCGLRVDFKDRRSPYGGTYDHVDPDGGNSLENCVIACRSCNEKKQCRTPAEANMPLLPPGTVWMPNTPKPEPFKPGLEPATVGGVDGQASRAREAASGTGLAVAESATDRDEIGQADGVGRPLAEATNGAAAVPGNGHVKGKEK